jgi:hypothetical protein
VFERKCRHQSFDSLLELQFHLHDRHGVRELWREDSQRSIQQEGGRVLYFVRNPVRRVVCKKDEDEDEDEDENENDEISFLDGLACCPQYFLQPGSAKAGVRGSISQAPRK